MRHLALVAALFVGTAALPLSATSCGVVSHPDVVRAKLDALLAALPPELIPEALAVKDAVSAGRWLDALALTGKLLGEVTDTRVLDAAQELWDALVDVTPPSAEKTRVVAEGRSRLLFKRMELTRPR